MTEIYETTAAIWQKHHQHKNKYINNSLLMNGPVRQKSCSSSPTVITNHKKLSRSRLMQSGEDPQNFQISNATKAVVD